MKLTPEFLKADGSRQLLNLLMSPGLVANVDAPSPAAFVPQKRHLADLLPVISVGPGVTSVPRLVGAGLDAGTQSSEGSAAPSNAAAELELVRQPFTTVVASLTASRQVLDDSALVEALIGGELREALRASADAELARMLAEHAPLLTATGSTDFVPSIVEGTFAFQKRWGAPRAIILDHAKAEENAAQLIAGSPGVVSFDADALRICGVPVVACDMPDADQAIITRAAILQREAEGVVSSRLHGDNFVKNRVTLLASCRLAAVGPSLRVAV